ncbi:antitoxin VbhA family protein [Gulosibacter bifidus]|uniref:Antitoxin VbhA family protein n=1 Tax=Gulosibacter bifidus TaxID=272239 RepID=A0ABW5RHV9_9MICO|nr:antitoxin VbhA family protein [Gulosibacter bifidus]
MSDNAVQTPSSDDEVQRMLDSVHGILGAAGHAITDTAVLNLLERYARGEISGDECRDRMKQHILNP